MATLRVPLFVPPASEDSEELMKAFEGLGTDEGAIISILGHRNASQRKKIREMYERLYDKPLVEELHSELSGDFRDAVILWTHDPAERDARLANKALNSCSKGIISHLKVRGKDTITHLQVIVEIACATPPDHLMAVRQAYCSLFDCSLEEDITSKVSLPVRKVLLGLVSSYRYNGNVVDSNIANSEATKLYEAIQSKHLDDDEFLWILGTRNFFQLKKTFECYQKKYRNSIYQDIKSRGNGILELVLGVVIWCIDSPEKHFAEVIRASVVGLGTDEDSLTRAILARAEIDMKKIREEYYKENKTSLDDAVRDDTSGDYRSFLMTLLGDKY
ncbi:annexin D3-like [Diospyros lotus]|uniref:annexin D3-like n=1 Tax=Diospyros lotus TaxID=55363 RepID=UPI0022527F60|nr:annexin D3-like [Diospyros lotus]